MRIDEDEPTLSDTAAESTSTRIQDTEWLCIGWWRTIDLAIHGNVILVGADLPGILEVFLRPTLILVVIDEEIPSQLVVLGGQTLEAWDGDIGISILQFENQHWRKKGTLQEFTYLVVSSFD